MVNINKPLGLRLLLRRSSTSGDIGMIVGFVTGGLPAGVESLAIDVVLGGVSSDDNPTVLGWRCGDATGAVPPGMDASGLITSGVLRETWAKVFPK